MLGCVMGTSLLVMGTSLHLLLGKPLVISDACMHDECMHFGGLGVLLALGLSALMGAATACGKLM